MTVREIQAFLGEMYAVDVSPDLISTVTDGLTGMSEALAAVYPATTLQTCIVHLLRHSLNFANWKGRKPLAAALRPIYTAASADAALLVLDDFEHSPEGVRFPTVVAAWRRAWAHVIPFFAFPPEVRRVIYMIHALESTHSQLRKCPHASPLHGRERKKEGRKAGRQAEAFNRLTHETPDSPILRTP